MNRGWRQSWPRILLILLAFLVLIQAVRLVWAIAVPAGPIGRWQNGTAQILPPREALTLFASLDPFFRAATGGVSGGAVTALDLTLFGVNMNEASGGGSAIIAGADGVQSSFAVGEEVLPGVTLAAVAFDSVVLDRGGVRENLFLDQSTPVTATAAVPAGAAPPATENGAAVASGALSPQAIQAGVAFAPRAEGGKVTGVIVQPQGDGAAFRASGLRPGDVIRGVNGRPVSAAGDLAGQMLPGARLSLEVERSGAVVPIALIIGKP